MKRLKVWLTEEETHRDSSCVLFTFIGHGNEKGWLMDKDEKVRRDGTGQNGMGEGGDWA